MTTADDTARYKELLDVAPAESLELIHEEAFGKLSASERQEMFDALTSSATNADERPTGPSAEELATAAARQENNRPGALGRLFGRDDESDPSSALFATFVAYAIGSELSFGLLTAAPFGDGPDDGGPVDFGGGFDADGFDGGF
jgi:hypothetical protein